MPKIICYNSAGVESEKLEVSEAVFAVRPKKSVIHQVFVAILANSRRPWADTKDRGDVSGGGKKPWKQKGTGRARHGSIRSPIWKGGGVTFGPLSARNYHQKINKKMNQTALRMCLSDRVSNERLAAVEAFPDTGKTKLMAEFISKIPGKGKSTLFIVKERIPAIEQAMRNIKRLSLVRAQDVNVVDVLNNQYLFATKDAVLALEERLSKK